jgi:hypothetical protein
MKIENREDAWAGGDSDAENTRPFEAQGKRARVGFGIHGGKIV